MATTLMRLLAQPDVWVRELGEAGREYIAVYVDCNRMLEMTTPSYVRVISLASRSIRRFSTG